MPSIGRSVSPLTPAAAICNWRNACIRALSLRSPVPLPRHASSGPKDEPEDRYNYNDRFAFDSTPDPEHLKYPTVTARQLRRGSSPPRGVKMLVRDFIDDSLYNPQYGYFSKQAVIFSPSNPFDFPSIKNSAAFGALVAARYAEGNLTEDMNVPTRPLWHTPAELFQPWYGRALAQCLTADYMLKSFPYEDFIIYELGAGNGTLARNILDFLKEDYPDVYDRTSYRIIEISSRLAAIQAKQLRSEHPCVRIVNKSIMDWNETVLSPCYVVATEVIDNFSHDVVRYRTDDLKPAQALTVIDTNGNFSEIYEPVSDPLISRYLSYRHRLRHRPPALTPFLTWPSLRYVRNSLPFASNLSPPEFIPTTLLLFLEALARNFPLHRLLLSDFSSLPNAIPGYNAPVVQTRHQHTTIPVSTYLVQPGYFDIFFPTSFERLSDMYDFVMSRSSQPAEWRARSSPLSPTSSVLASDFFSPRARRVAEGTYSTGTVGPRISSIFTHREFLTRYANLEATTLMNGENPLLEYYQNVKFLF